QSAAGRGGRSGWLVEAPRVARGSGAAGGPLRSGGAAVHPVAGLRDRARRRTAARRAVPAQRSALGAGLLAERFLDLAGRRDRVVDVARQGACLLGGVR